MASGTRHWPPGSPNPLLPKVAQHSGVLAPHRGTRVTPASGGAGAVLCGPPGQRPTRARRWGRAVPPARRGPGTGPGSQQRSSQPRPAAALRVPGGWPSREPTARGPAAARVTGLGAHLARDLVQRVVLRRQPLPGGEPPAPRALRAHVHRPRRQLLPTGRSRPSPAAATRPSLRRGVMASAGAGRHAGTRGRGRGQRGRREAWGRDRGEARGQDGGDQGRWEDGAEDRC